MARLSTWAVVTLIIALSMLMASCNGPRNQSAARLTEQLAGLTSKIGPIGRSCEGVTVTATANIQDVIDSYPPGTIFCLSAVTYRLNAPLVPKNGDALVGYQGATLSGSRVLAGWRTNSSSWSTTGFLPSTSGTHGKCAASAPTCTNTEDVFLDKRLLRRVSSAGEVVPGTVYVDYSSNTITLGDDPQSHLIEQAIAPSLIQSAADDVTIANLVLEEAANDAQLGAIENIKDPSGRHGSGWRILNNDVQLNHGVGINFADASTAAGNIIHYQGQIGFGAQGKGSIFNNNDVSFNNTAGYSVEWEAGGGKIWTTVDTILTHNYVHDNIGPGLWADGGNIGTIYEHNRVANNLNSGIKHEISYDAIIEGNDISGNGQKDKDSPDAGIEIQSSGGISLIEVTNNDVAGNSNGIILLNEGNRGQERPKPFGPHAMQNIWVHNNTITMLKGEKTGTVEYMNNPAIFPSKNVRFDANKYFLDSLTDPHFTWAHAEADWAHWSSTGDKNDVNGRAQLLRR